MAYASEADIVGYGGAAGGGKTDLAAGAYDLDLYYRTTTSLVRVNQTLKKITISAATKVPPNNISSILAPRVIRFGARVTW